jgi:hypothetical protein
MAELAAYLQGLGFSPAMPLRPVSSWQQAATVCQSPSDEWWRAEELVRERLERSARLDPADRSWLELNAALHGAAAVAAARAGCADATLIGVYDGAFAIF